VALAFAVLAVSAGGSAEEPAVHVAGRTLADTAGTPIRLLGVNRSGTEYACISGQGLIEGPTDAQAIAAMAAWRIDTVRIPLNEDCWLGINGAPAGTSGAPYRAAIEGYVSGLHDAGMRVVLDLHWNRYQQVAGPHALGEQRGAVEREDGVVPRVRLRLERAVGDVGRPSGPKALGHEPRVLRSPTAAGTSVAASSTVIAQPARIIPASSHPSGPLGVPIPHGIPARRSGRSPAV
jgi:hypothetical protein